VKDHPALKLDYYRNWSRNFFGSHRQRCLDAFPGGIHAGDVPLIQAPELPVRVRDLAWGEHCFSILGVPAAFQGDTLLVTNDR
jgi:hypothetical protein